MMTKADIMRKYFPALQNKLINAEQYKWLITQGCSDGPEKEMELKSGKPNDEVQAIIDAFGGRETPGATATTHTEPAKGTTQKQRLLNLLRDGEWHTTIEILHTVYGQEGDKGIARAGARIWDLKADGYQIESRKANGSIWEYRMITYGGNREGSGEDLVPTPA